MPALSPGQRAEASSAKVPLLSLFLVALLPDQRVTALRQLLSKKAYNGIVTRPVAVFSQDLTVYFILLPQLP